MKQEKFNISLERNLLRLNSKGNITNAAYPKTFGNKEKNNFIKIDTKDYILKLTSPIGTNINDVYNKLQEITNVVYVELYNLKEIIWPFSNFENIELTNKITLSIDKEYYEEIKNVNKNLPEKLEDAYKNLKEEFKNKSTLLENVFGKCTLKISKNNIELSNIKVNYEDRYGITLDEVYFLVTFIFSLLEKSEENTLTDLIKRLNKIAKQYSLKSANSIKIIANYLKSKKTRLESEKALNDTEKLELAKQYMNDGNETRYSMVKHHKLVAACVCIIKDAISQGIDYKILNEEKSVVQFNLNGHKEFVIEGNKTDRDTYIFPIITDDKLISKQIMADFGLNVPTATLLESEMSEEEIEEIASKFYNRTVVVKPRNTNYGTGITVFNEKASKKEILNAIKYAFRFDTNVLLEEYAKGMEYRFLVIDGKCISIAYRRASSIVGDGKSTINELIDIKNKELWHREASSLVKKDDVVVEYLKLQGFDYNTIVPEGKRVYLRTNSNCSTGGEAVDMTDIIPTKFKKIAEKAAKAFDAKICGVDIIIEDLKSDKYAIVEINDNPGYAINQWPYEGKGERIGLSILELLDLVQE